MEEIHRNKRVLNMMISMHSTLRDKYYRLSLAFKILLFTSSVILNSFVFADTEFVQEFGIAAPSIELSIGVASIIVFLVSIIMFVVQWDKKSANHEEAKKQLSHLLNEAREIISNSKNITEQEVKSFVQKYSQVNSMLVPIPEKKFNKLKHKHLHKVELSKYISKNPKYPYLLIRIRFFINSFKDEK